jgi:hypothetical protein
MKKIYSITGTIVPAFVAFDAIIEIPLTEHLGHSCRKSINFDDVYPVIALLQSRLPAKINTLFTPAEDEGVMKIFILGPDRSTNLDYNLIEKAFQDCGFEPA